MVLKQKMAVQEVSLLISQEQKILCSLSHMIFSSIYQKKCNIFKRKCLQLSTLNLKPLKYPIIYQTLYHEYYLHIKSSHYKLLQHQ